MDWTEADGETYKDAVEILLLSLGAHRSEVEIEEIGERKKLFGLGKKVIRVKGRIKDEALADIDGEASLKSLTSSLSSEIAKIGRSNLGESAEKQGKKESRKGRDRNRRPEKNADNAARSERGAEKRKREVRHTPPPTAKIFGEGATTEVSDECAGFLTEVLKAMGVSAKVAGEENDGSVLLDITSEAGGFIIGRKGETLEALSKILEIYATRKKGSHTRVIVDTENYRVRREEKLVDQAVTSAKKVVETGKKVRLAPMKTEERKIIHFSLQGDTDVETRSEGRDENRRVVIFPARGNMPGK